MRSAYRKKVSCHCLTMPRKWLFIRTIFTPIPDCIQFPAPVYSSGILRRLQSPRPRAPDCRFSSDAAGSPNPMVPNPPEVTQLLLFLNLEYLALNIWFCPTSVTTMAPASVFFGNFCDYLSHAYIVRTCEFRSDYLVMFVTVLFPCKVEPLFSVAVFHLFCNLCQSLFCICVYARSLFMFLSISALSISIWMIFALWHIRESLL